MITSLIIKKILKTGELSAKEVFKSDDGKAVICEIGESGWTFQVENDEGEEAD